MEGSSMAAVAFRVAALSLACASCTSIAVTRASLDGTSWRVAAIDGQATPAVGNYSMSFTGGSVAARFGCNSIGGRYVASGETLTTSEVRSTLMGCPEPSATFEREGSAVLGSAMRIDWSGSGRLTLSNSAGSIALERAP